MKYLSFFITFLLAGSLAAQNNFDLIPKPTELSVNQGLYNIPSHPVIHVNKDFKEVAELLEEHPAIQTVNISTRKAKKAAIRIIKPTGNTLKPEAYDLEINHNGITITAHDIPQAISGIYTLIQLGYIQENSRQIAFAKITDEPRFGYRGLHLDVSRHYMPLSFIKKYIDLMAIYKFNNFHWHFTDGAGWRIEIKKYPELTDVAAWRAYASINDWWSRGKMFSHKGDPNASGGFYTQEEARELVAYAAKKGINVIPEIEMPAHSEEVFAVYPELSCTGDHTKQGEFCIGNPKTFEFLQDVIDEIIDIFPSKLIHMGGDEANKSHWGKCPKCQALMEKEGLKDLDELQSYAIRRMDNYLQSKGRVLMGWDEIIEGGLSEGATVMSWTGEQNGIKAANMGHDVVMTPITHLYFDYYQADPKTQPPAIGGYTTIERVYSYDPIPEAIAPDKRHHILGAQANLWTEYVSTTGHAEYMVYPRAIALAEVNWIQPEEKDWDDFKKRLQSQYRLLQSFNVNYYRPSYNVNYTNEFNPKDITSTVNLTTEQMYPENIRYTLDGSEPTADSKVYSGPMIFTESQKVKAGYFLGKQQMGLTLDFDVDLHKAIGKEVTYINPYQGYPAQKELTLTNGIRGGYGYGDGQWQGFIKPLDVVVDMGSKQDIQRVGAYFMQLISQGIYMPGEFEVLVSDDKENYTSVGIQVNTISDKVAEQLFERFEIKLDQPVSARYVRVKASNPKRGYMFTDEIMIY